MLGRLRASVPDAATLADAITRLPADSLPWTIVDHLGNSTRVEAVTLHVTDGIISRRPAPVIRHIVITARTSDGDPIVHTHRIERARTSWCRTRAA